MASNRSEIDDVLPDGKAIRSEEIGFAAGELLACAQCSRTNSPERQNCIYCGESMGSATSELLLTPVDNPLETWESGFNLVIRFDVDAEPGSLAGLAELFAGNGDLLARAMDRRTALPIGRFASVELATAAIERFGEKGFDLRIVSDLELNTSQPPVRLRGITFSDEDLILHEFNGDKVISVPSNDLRLVVEGNLFETKTEETQKKRRRNKSEVEILRIESDRPVIDIYTKGNNRGFRVSIHGFDFSCLGSDKQLLAAANLAQLSKKLTKFSPECRIDNSYGLMRTMFDPVWAIDSAKDHKGMLRVGLERKGRTIVETRTNEMQFTKYSRLQALSI